MSDSLIASARQIYKTKGVVALVGRTLLYLRQHLLMYVHCYLYECIIQERNEADYIPKIRGFNLKIVSTNDQADEIASEGFQDIRDCDLLVNARSCLNKGAIAFCLFMGQELAHIAWVATNKEAKNTFDHLPYHVDFANGQACTGGTLTLPKFRGNGFMAYGQFKRLEFLQKQGYKTSRNAVATDNKVSQKVHAKFDPIIYAEARYLKIARWTFWKEHTLSP